VSIPIYSTTQRGVDLNISLSYDTGGLLVSQLPSWTGHGWTLNAGGCITRKLQGYYDEDENCVKAISRHPLPDLVNYFNNTKTIDNQTDLEIANDVTNGKKVYDYSPDIFFFNFMGKSGRFFFGPDKKWHVQCEENLKVEFNVNDASNYLLPFIPNYPNYTYKMSKTIKGFTLIDEEGIRYTFGGTTDAIEYSIGFLDQDVEDWRANSWYLTEVKDRFGNVLYKFNYKRGKFIVQLFNNYLKSITFLQEKRPTGYGEKRYSKELRGNTNASFPFSATLNAPVYLSNITTQDKTSIDFKLSVDINIPETELYPSFDRYCQKDITLIDGTRLFNQAGVPYLFRLDSIHKISGNDQYLYYLRNHSGLSEGNMKYWDADVAKQVKAEFPNNTAMETGCGWDNPLKVLSFTPLQSIDIINKANSSIGKRIRYIDFVYNTEPRLHMSAVNMYGEDGKSSVAPAYSYKMEYNNYSLIPKDYLTEKFDYWGYYNNDSLTSEVNHVTTQYGTLSKLIYPTGGYSEFIYEQNSFSQCINDTIYEMEYCLRDSITGGLRIKQINDCSSNGNLSKARQFSYFNIGYDTDMSSGQCYRLPRQLSQELYYVDFGSSYFYKHTLCYNKKSSVVPLTDSYGPHIGYTWITEKIDGIEKEYKYSNFSDYYCEEKPFRVAGGTWYNNNINLNSPYITFTDFGFARGKKLSERVKENGRSVYECTYQYDYKPSRYVPSTTFGIKYEKGLQGGFLVGCAFKLYYSNFELVKKFEKHYYRDGTSTYDITEYDMTDFTPNSNDPSFFLRKLNSVNQSRMSHDKVLESVKTQYSYLPSETYDYYFPISQVKTFHNGIETNRKTYLYSSYPSIAGHKLLSQEKTQQYPDFSKETIWVSYDQYDKTGLLLQYTERSKGTTYLGWDNYGRLVKISKGNSDDLVTYFGYTVDGKKNQKKIPNGYVTNYGYDSFGRLNRVYDKEGDIQTYNYNFKKK
jgi:YD repeat-containing protein